MNIQEIVQILINSGIEPNEATKEVKMLIEHFCNYTAKDIIMGRPLNYEKLKIVKNKAELRAKTKQPIQYIVGKAYFMGNYYEVNKNVLIPRDETELVVRRAIDIINKKGYKSVLDIGTGSGCIACSISQNTKAKVVGVDISIQALQTARKNAKNLYCEVEFIESDLFSSINQKFDLIISNPPYIPQGTELQKEVGFEPKLALFTSDDTGCEYYQKIIEQSKNYLNMNSHLIFELGINQAEIVKKIFEENGFSNISVEKDLANINRVIFAEYIQ